MSENLQGVPTRFIGVCEMCQLQLDTRAEGVHQWTCGWVKIREGGGGHGISLAVRSQRWAHGACVERRIKGWDKQQPLFPTGR